MRITLVIGGIGTGGAERVLSILASLWCERGHRVHIICADAGHSPPFYPLDPRVTLQYLGVLPWRGSAAKRALAFLRALRAFRAAIRGSDPTLVIALIELVNMLTLLSTVGLSLPVVVCEHTYPPGWPIGLAWEALRRITYPRAASVVALTPAGLSYFSKAVQRSGAVIPNPVVLPTRYRGAALRRDKSAKCKTLVALARLAPAKGYDLLLRAFALAAKSQPDWSLEIWGEGSERPALERLAVELGIAGRVRLPGITSEPFEKLTAADLYVLSSRIEGFPMALCEAMACGLPVVSFDCLSGPREIIRDGVDGVLVPPGDVEALARSLTQLMQDEALRGKLAARAPEVLDRFSGPRIMEQWDALFARVLSRGRPAPPAAWVKDTAERAKKTFAKV